MAREMTLRIVLERPPKGVDFGLQKGRGSGYETTQKQRSDGKDLTFEFTPLIKDSVSDAVAALSAPLYRGRLASVLSTSISARLRARWIRAGAAA
jgi:hypothetical protein